MFGSVAEGTQRACVERALKLTKVSDIFLTGRVEWKRMGGLIGMILSMADAAASSAAETAPKKKRVRSTGAVGLGDLDGSAQDRTGGRADGERSDDRPTLTVHGGRNVTHTLATARRFVFRQTMPVNIEEYAGTEPKTNWEPTWGDENIQVWAMGISPSSNKVQPTTPKLKHTRKRSYDEFEDGGTNIAGMEPYQEGSLHERRDREQQIRKAVVSEMFDSAWRLDSLVEMPLAEVILPAAIFVRNKQTRNIEPYDGPMPGGEVEIPKIQVLVRRPWPGALLENLPATQPSHMAMSYIIRNHYQRGAFQRKKAEALNVQLGPKWAALASGRSVLSEDGKTITPDMVLNPGKIGGGLAVVDLPTSQYIDNLISRPEWRASEVMDGVHAIFWMLGPGVIHDERLHAFIQGLSHLKHMVASEDTCPNHLTFESVSAMAIRLNQIDPVRFPIPVHDNVSLPQTTGRNVGEGEQSRVATQTLPLQRAERGLRLHLEPTFKVDDAWLVKPLNTAVVLQETPKEVLALGEQARRELASNGTRERLEAEQAHLPSRDAEIITLGTGSALPSKYRNVSSTLLRVPGYGSYMLDCGENTLGQMKRVFTPDELSEVLRDLKVIWISHLHADHHLGTTSVIKAWYDEVHGGQPPESDTPLPEQLSDLGNVLQGQRRLFVASDRSFCDWLSDYSSVEDFGYNRIVSLCVSCQRFTAGRPVGERNVTNLTWDGRPIAFQSSNTSL